MSKLSHGHKQPLELVSQEMYRQQSPFGDALLRDIGLSMQSLSNIFFNRAKQCYQVTPSVIERIYICEYCGNRYPMMPLDMYKQKRCPTCAGQEFKVE